MSSFQRIVADDVRVDKAMRGEFDLRRGEFSLAMTASGMDAARQEDGDAAARMLTLLRMPVMDGFHFLAFLMNRGPELPIVLRNSPDSDNAHLYLLQKQPLSRLPALSGHRARAAPGHEARWRPAHASRRGVTLLEFLSFCAEERQTRVLEVSAAGRTATFHLTFGRLIHARSQEQQGPEVFFDVVRWEEPSLRILPTLPGLEVSITDEMDLLLSQAEASLQPAVKLPSSQESRTVPEARCDAPAPGMLPATRAVSPRDSSNRESASFASRLFAWMAEGL